MLTYFIYFLFPFMMIYACFTDLFEMTISNKVSLALMAGFMGFAFLIGMDVQAMLWHWAMFGVILLGGFSLFAFNVIGGGDAKLAAATGLWFGWSHAASYLLLAAALGGVLTLLMLKFRSELLPERLSRVPWINRLHDTNNGVPYGIALGISAVIIYPHTKWSEHIYSLAASL